VTLRLEALDPAVWALTLEAVAASKHDDRCLRVVCRECGRALAWAGVTKKGPLFTSSWVTEIEHDEDMVLDARRLRPGERRLALEAAGAEITTEGPSMDQGRDGVVSLLALPVGMTPDYPDLLVRCDSHGDAVLDRAETLARVRAARSPWKVTLSLPTREYEPLRNDWPEELGRTEHARETIRMARRPSGDHNA